MSNPQTNVDLSGVASTSRGQVDINAFIKQLRGLTGEDLDKDYAKTIVDVLKGVDESQLSKGNAAWRQKVLSETMGMSSPKAIREALLANSDRPNVANAVKAKAKEGVAKVQQETLFEGEKAPKVEAGKVVKAKKVAKTTPSAAPPIDKPGPSVSPTLPPEAKPVVSPKGGVPRKVGIPRNAVPPSTVAPVGVTQSPVSPALSSFTKATKSAGVYGGLTSDADLAQLAALTPSERKTYVEFVRGGMEQSKALGVTKQMAQQRLATEAEKAASKVQKIGAGNIANAKVPAQGFSGPVSPYLERRFRTAGVTPGPTRRIPSVINPSNMRMQVGNVRLGGGGVVPPRQGLLDVTGPVDPLSSLADVSTAPKKMGLDSALERQLGSDSNIALRQSRAAKAEALAARKALPGKLLTKGVKALGVVGAVMTVGEVLDALSSDPREKASQELAGETEMFGQAARSAAVEASLTSEEKALSDLVGMAEADAYGQRAASYERQAQVLELVGPDLVKLQQASTPTRPSFAEMMLKMGAMP